MRKTTKISSEEQVVLVSRNNKVLGTAGKVEVHNKNTPLHRGFSVFLFNKEGLLLLQQRSKTKKTWPLVWSNSCCGHPMLNESSTEACKRRLKFELGITPHKVFNILPNFSYKVEKDGIVENELCPVLIAFSDQKPVINKNEVENIAWINWNDFLEKLRNDPSRYSEWCWLEVCELLQNKRFLALQKSAFHSNILKNVGT